MTQRSLTALRIGNFKAFADTQRIPLKPITLIFGPNSAGKSSLIQALAFAHQAQLGRNLHGGSSLDVHSTAIGGKSIDLGGFRQFVHRRDASNRVTWGADLEVAKLDMRSRELLAGVKVVSLTIEIAIGLDDRKRAKADAAPRVDSAEIAADGEVILRMSGRARRGNTNIANTSAARRTDNTSGPILRVDRLASSHPVWHTIVAAILESSTTATTISDSDFSLADAAIFELLPELDASCPRLVPDGVRLRNIEVQPVKLGDMLLPMGRADRSEDIARALHAYLPAIVNDLVGGLSRALDAEFSTLRYLGPVRERPTRHFVAQEQRDANWTAGGGFAWEILTHDEAVRDRVNQWLGGHLGVPAIDAALDAMAPDGESPEDRIQTPYQLFVDRYTPNKELAETLKQAFAEQPLTLLQRREMLTKELAEVYAELEEIYETDRARVERYAKEFEPWLVQIKAARSRDEAERIRQEAMASFARKDELQKTDDAVWGEIRLQQDIDQANDVEQRARVVDFMTALDKRGIPTINELRLWDERRKTPVALCDVGFGISQVLPVLTLAYASEGALIAIEQPEIHLHPRLQAKFADVFIDSALGDQRNTFILETHSEHLILRIMKRMRQTWQKKETGLPSVTPADVSILYVEPDGKRSVVREMPLNEAGELVKAWPHGFFEEGLSERFDDA